MPMFRKAQRNDYNVVYSLICDLENTRLPKQRFVDIYEKQLDNESYYCMLCIENGEAIGIINLRFEEQLHHAGRIAEILEIAVAKDCRKRGIGKALLAQACFIAKENGCFQIEVSCNQLRIDAHRFYEREGMNNSHYKFSKSLTEEA